MSDNFCLEVALPAVAYRAWFLNYTGRPMLTADFNFESSLYCPVHGAVYKNFSSFNTHRHIYHKGEACSFTPMPEGTLLLCLEKDSASSFARKNYADVQCVQSASLEALAAVCSEERDRLPDENVDRGGQEVARVR